jgi:hypothetical protein
MKQFGFPQMMMGGDGGGGGGGEAEGDYEDAYAEALSDYGPVGHTDFSSSSVGRGALADTSFPGMEPDMGWDEQGFSNVDWESYGLSGRDSFQDMVNAALSQPGQSPQEADPFGFGPTGTFDQQSQGFADRFGGVNDTTHAIGASAFNAPASSNAPPPADLSWALAPGPLDQPPSDWFASLGLLSNTPGSPWGSPTSITVNAQPQGIGDQTDPGGPGPGIGPAGTPTSSSPVSGPVAGFAPEANPFGQGYSPSPISWAADGSFDPYGGGNYLNSLQNPDVQALIKNSPLVGQGYAYSQKYGWLPPEIAGAYLSQGGNGRGEGGNPGRSSAFLGEHGFMPYWYDENPRTASLIDAWNGRDYLSQLPAAPRANAPSPGFASAPMSSPPMTFDQPMQGPSPMASPPGMDQQQFIQSMYSQVQAPPGTQAPSPNHYFDGNQWQEATANSLPSWLQYNQA